MLVMMYRYNKMLTNMSTSSVSANVVYVPYYTSVEHIDPPKAWQLIKSDDDRAYYFVSGNAALSIIPSQGDKVYLPDNIEAKIQDVSVKGFVLSMNDYDIKSGLSGLPVCNLDEEVLGYVSAQIGNNSVFCVWR